MINPLIGRKVLWTFENALLGASFEIEFVSSKELTSRGHGMAEGFFVTVPYEMSIIRDNVFLVIYSVKLDDLNEVISIVVDIAQAKVNACRVTNGFTTQLMIGTVEEIAK